MYAVDFVSWEEEEILRRTWNNRQDSTVWEEPKRGKSESGVEEGTEEEKKEGQGATYITGVEEG